MRILRNLTSKKVENETETLDSTNEETDSTETTDESDSLKEKNRQLFERAKKAETELKELKSKSKEPKVETKSNDDYGRLLLEVKGVSHEDDISYVEQEAKDTGKTISDVMKFKYVQEHLNEAKAKRQSLDATDITGTKKSGQFTGKNVDYWYDRYLSGEAKFADVPKEFRREIVLKRETKEKTGGKYYNSLS